MDDAGATLAGIAADVRSGKSQVVTQKADEQQPRLDFRRVFNAIDLHPDRDPAGRGHGRRHGLCTPPLTWRRGTGPGVTNPIGSICHLRPTANPTGPKVDLVWLPEVDASARNRRRASTRAGSPPQVGLADYVGASIPPTRVAGD